VFYGVGAAVIAIIVRSVQKLTKLTLADDRLLWAVFVINAAVTAVTESEIVWVFVASGALVYVVPIGGAAIVLGRGRSSTSRRSGSRSRRCSCCSS
jgi:chromate transport protein ChrA